jgi:hypothetical protein
MHDDKPHRDKQPQDYADVPFEQIGDLVISPQTDIPFGEPFRMGLAVYTIYDRAVKDGYQAGIQRHLEFIQDHPGCSPTILDDEGFHLVLDTFMPEGLSEHDASQWRSSFIAGWASIFLGLVRETKREK